MDFSSYDKAFGFYGPDSQLPEPWRSVINVANAADWIPLVSVISGIARIGLVTHNAKEGGLPAELVITEIARGVLALFCLGFLLIGPDIYFTIKRNSIPEEPQTLYFECKAN